MSIPAPPKAYSYLRFSTPEQASGDSFRRQNQMAVSYALAKGLELDDTLTFYDLGRSGYRGQNVETGRLGDFLEAVESGEVQPGSYLLVESLDRISRQAARRAFRILEDIADRGITVVTLNDGREYSKESLDRDPTDLLLSILQFMRANEESATKARRLKEAWSVKRDRLASGEVLTSRVPAWMRLDLDSGQIQLIPQRAKIVERIFRDTLAGKGQHAIAADLNREGVEPWGRGAFWHRSYIAKILASEAVIGTFTPHTVDYVEGKKTRTAQEPVRGYYPAAVPEDLWLDVQALRDGKRPRPRGRNAERPASHMLARLATCPLCEGSMSRVAKGKRSRPSLVCARAKTRAGCDYKAIRVDAIEEAIVERLPARLRDAPAGDRDAELDRAVLDQSEALSDVSERIERVLAAIEEGGDSRALTTRLRDLEGEYEEARDALRRLEARRAGTAGQTIQARVKRLLGTLERQEGDPINMAAVNGAMLLVFRRVTVDYPNGTLEFEWQHGGSVDVPYGVPLES